KVIDSVILVDGQVHKGEINIMGELMKRIDFDSNFIMQARNIGEEQGLSILNNMPQDKKKNLTMILDEVAISDGFVHEKEIALISSICSAMGLAE
ncbi:MAG: hypothetical protein COC08_01880, partial [Maribacter sp.]